jgi:nitrate reductase gamma subunit
MSALAIGYAAFLRRHRDAGGGRGLKIRSYWRTPAPLLIPTTPAPTSTGGVALRLTREVVFFESLFKGSKWTWLFGWLFHASLLLVLLRHVRYFQQPVWAPIVFVQFFGTYAGLTMVAGLAGLWARRFLVDRVRYISTPSDHLHLALLWPSDLSGLGMRFVAHTDIVAVKAFMLGLMRLDIQPLPSRPAAAAAPGAGGAADDRLPDQQAAACAGPVLQPHAQPDRQPARRAPPGGLGGGAGPLKVAAMATAKFETPALKPYPVIPLVAEGAMAHSKPFVASAAIQSNIGFPGELTEGWEQRAVAKMGELLGKYRSACASTWTPACTAAPAATSATTSWARATPRTCRWRART